jgi:hypothetical protein
LEIKKGSSNRQDGQGYTFRPDEADQQNLIYKADYPVKKAGQKRILFGVCGIEVKNNNIYYP